MTEAKPKVGPTEWFQSRRRAVVGQYILHPLAYKDALLQKDDGSHTKTKRQTHEEGHNHESHRRRRVPEGSTNIIDTYVNVISNSILFYMESMVKPYHRPPTYGSY